MNKFKFISFIIVLIPFSLFSQSIETLEEEMKNIKLSEDLIYGESFNENKNIAFDNALTELLITANEIRDEKGLSPIKSSDLLPLIKELNFQLDNRYEVLVYLPLVDIYKLTSKSNSDVIAQLAPSKANTDNKTQEKNKEKIYGDLTFVPNSPSQNTTPSSSTSSSNTINSNPSPLPDNIVKTLSNQDNWIEIKGLLTSYKGEGKIKETGFTQNFDEIPEDAFTILIDEMYGILAILSPKNSSNRINYKTNLSDSESNYSNCKVIVWYK